MLKLLKKIGYLPQLVLLVLFVIIRYIPSISPDEYQIMGVLGLMTPTLAVLNLALLLFWIIRKKYFWAGIAALGFFISWNVLSVCFGFNFLKKNTLVKNNHEFTVMSYNVRLLDLYDWTGDKNNRKKLLSFIQKKSPDVLCLQEFYTKDGTGLDNINAIKKIGGYDYAETCALKRHQNRQWGSVVFSRFPIVQNTNVVINEEDKNLIQETIIEKDSQKVRIYNIHLHSNKLSGRDIAWDKNDDVLGTAKKALKNSKSVFDKLLRAYKQRGKEANLSAFVIEENMLYPTIVCGDLNDLPSSYSYFNIRGKLKDAFLERGNGVGPTYNGKVSFLRIDYMFFSDKVRLKAFEKFKVPYSDHYPLMGKYEIL
jgi:endonuclease/exonuclease/phosphatase family metal-dependent hydrolase